jgi:hypothetical protein
MKKIIIYLSIFLFVSFISYIGFGFWIPVEASNTTSPIGNPQKTTENIIPGTIQFEGPKTEICPINGEKFTKKEKEIWETRRPLLVMIENHLNSRPQSGLQNADIVYEAVAEGGITRFMGVFYCNAIRGASSKYDLGPVRSARSYFLDIASEYGDYPLYAHVGGANCSAVIDPVTGKQIGACTSDKRAMAIEQIASYGWNNEGTWSDLSQFSLPYKACRREPERTGETRDTEHTMYCSSTELWNIASARGLTNITTKTKNSWDKNYKSWNFKKDDKTSESVTAKKISFSFWTSQPNYDVSWEYDQANNRYLRSNANKVQIDHNTQQTIHTKNIVLQFVKETRSVDVHLHNLYDVIGSGNGVLLQNGEKIEITWSKASRAARTIFKDKNGKEINFVPGQIWVEILPLKTEVDYEI